MKHRSVFFSLTRVVIILTAVFFFGAQADDKKGGKDPRAEKFRAVEEKIWGAVKAGKLSKEDAQKKLGVIKKQIWADKGKEQNRDGKDPRAEKFRATEDKIWAAVKAGKLSKRDAMKKLEGLKKEMFDDHVKKDWGGKKGWDAQKKLGGTKAHVLAALTKGTNCSACHVHKKDWDKMDWGKMDWGKMDWGWNKKDWDSKKDWDGKKSRDGKPASDIEVLKRQLEALKRENEGLRKRLEKRKDR